MPFDAMLNSTDESLWERWRKHAQAHPEREAIVHWVAGLAPHRWRWRALMDSAAAFGEQLSGAGVGAGDVCALVIRHHRDFYPLYMGVVGLGALPAVLAYPNARLHPDKFRQGLGGMARRSGLDWILTERELDPVVRPLVEGGDSTIRGVLFPLDAEGGERPVATAGFRAAHASPDAPCLLQHSSGTTGLQKAVMLSHRAVLEHVRRYGEAIDLAQDDRVVSWLPLYHDMGLIAAFELPLAFGTPTVQLDPFEWVTAPVLLLEAITQERATLAWLPNFAYNLMADRIQDDELAQVRLDSVRMLINCSEPVRAESHDKLYARFAPYGLKHEALAACYAMAETTFAVTQTPPGAQATTVQVDRDELAQGRLTFTPDPRRARACVSSGRPISGCELRVLGTAGEILPHDAIGELAVRSVSLFSGYRNNPEKTAEVLSNGWYATGDYGFAHEGDYYVIGRKKDIIIVAGKNIYPEDIEDAVGRVPGVLPGRVVSFGVDDPRVGTEEICVVAEAAEDADRKKLRLAVVQEGMKIDVTIGRVYLVPPRWLIKSSAGKPSRSANKERCLAELTPV
jgi:acyl-CoA synthetase (AMP-forming)/AMP-acid ligase II